jgi:hypothetical protein
MPFSREDLIEKLMKIQGGCCFIGGEPIDLSLHKVEIDHIIPRAKGGKDEENNYALVCEYHNHTKSDSDLRIARCMAKYESIKEQYSAKGSNRPNLGDFLQEFGAGKREIRVQFDGGMLRYSLPEKDSSTSTTYDSL